MKLGRACVDVQVQKIGETLVTETCQRPVVDKLGLAIILLSEAQGNFESALIVHIISNFKKIYLLKQSCTSLVLLMCQPPL